MRAGTAPPLALQLHPAAACHACCAPCCPLRRPRGWRRWTAHPPGPPAPTTSFPTPRAAPTPSCWRRRRAWWPPRCPIISAQEIGLQGALLVIPPDGAAPRFLSLEDALSLSLQGEGVQLGKVELVVRAAIAALDSLAASGSGEAGSSGGGDSEAAAAAVLSQLHATLAALTTSTPSAPLHEAVAQLHATTRALVRYVVDAATQRSLELRGRTGPAWASAETEEQRAKRAKLAAPPPPRKAAEAAAASIYESSPSALNRFKWAGTQAAQRFNAAVEEEGGIFQAKVRGSSSQLGSLVHWEEQPAAWCTGKCSQQQAERQRGQHLASQPSPSRARCAACSSVAAHGAARAARHENGGLASQIRAGQGSGEAAGWERIAGCCGLSTCVLLQSPARGDHTAAPQPPSG